MSKTYTSAWSSQATRWWKRFCSPDKGDPAVRARLRRCRDRVDAAMIPQALILGRTLVPDPDADISGEQFGIALDLARVLAHVKTDDVRPPMRSVGWDRFPTGGDEERPPLSELRFKRLLQATEGEGRVDAFIRLIALMDATANVAEIAESFRWWGHPDGRAQKRWAFEYYNAANFTPEPVTAPSTVESD
jgi:CRISPR system Cascade subunit CasB